MLLRYRRFQLMGMGWMKVNPFFWNLERILDHIVGAQELVESEFVEGYLEKLIAKRKLFEAFECIEYIKKLVNEKGTLKRRSK